ncbi:cell division protein ZapA [Dongshaea marina]|uniref:cell division protein ZapA n=1 Tax=Dongshaea marina TaxID=2047966 RepID=UPI000D3E0A20|nr:cell division protein ZapA [Dongshaea marina]
MTNPEDKTPTEAVEVTILDRIYKIACPAGQQEELIQAASQLREKIRDLKQRSRISNNEQVAIMVALNCCHELTLEKEKNHQYAENMDQRIKLLQNTIEQALTEHGSRLADDSKAVK